jgi:hypothetical protein
MDGETVRQDVTSGIDGETIRQDVTSGINGETIRRDVTSGINGETKVCILFSLERRTFSSEYRNKWPFV